MDLGRRVTLDNSGLGYRARSYANSYVPRPASPKMVSDMVPRQVEVLKAVEPSAVAPIARTFIQPPEVPREVPQVQLVQLPVQAAPQEPVPVSTPAATATPEPSLSEIDSLLQSIQGNARTRTFDKQLVQAPSDTSAQKKFKFRFTNKKSFAMSMAAVFLVVGGTVALVASFGNNKAVVKQVQALSETTNEDSSTGESTGFSDLNEEIIPESTVRSYSVSANYPKYIRIAKLGGQSSRILRMGIDETNTINTPRSIWDAGWYDGSAVPGDPVGASLILGHVSGPNDPGIFYNLYRIQDGDEIEVEMGDGRIFSYKVVGKQEVPTGSINMNDYLVSKDIDKPGLTLMTCAGEFNPSTQQYENRLAVFAIRTN